MIFKIPKVPSPVYNMKDIRFFLSRYVILIIYVWVRAHTETHNNNNTKIISDRFLCLSTTVYGCLRVFFRSMKILDVIFFSYGKPLTSRPLRRLSMDISYASWMHSYLFRRFALKYIHKLYIISGIYWRIGTMKFWVLHCTERSRAIFYAVNTKITMKQVVYKYIFIYIF